ncbi:acyltransferase [Mesorhizobium sp. Cs1299R1N1]|uniref:acyltransferase family protein n=1 Tax=Mesorhizobium sp. Cs1299R1N1 TaxID=3015172 RepID=UPI00301DDE47
MEITNVNGVASAKAARRPQLHNLTALRAVAALSIFIHHLKQLGIDASRSLWDLDLGCAVSFFFVLSGFVLSYSFQGKFQTSRDVRNFIAQRFFRIWPVHMLCFFFALVTLHSPRSFLTAYLTTALQSSWVPTYGTAYAYNGVSWSISVELFFYLLLPFILILKPRRILLVICGWTLAVLGLLALTTVLPHPVFAPTSGPTWPDLYVTDASFAQLFPPLRMAEFLSGIAVYQLFSGRRIPDKWVAFWQIAVAACLASYLSVHAEITQILLDHASVMVSFAYQEYGMYPLFAAMVYVFAHQSGGVTRILSSRLLVFCGEISFAFYMIHQIVIRNLLYFDCGPMAAAIAAGVASLLFAIIIHRTVENPFITWAKQWFPMMRQAPSSREAPVAATA